jgi:hypothetical protein
VWLGRCFGAGLHVHSGAQPAKSSFSLCFIPHHSIPAIDCLLMTESYLEALPCAPSDLTNPERLPIDCPFPVCGKDHPKWRWCADALVFFL